MPAGMGSTAMASSRVISFFSLRDGHVKIIYSARRSRWDCQDLAAGLVYGGRDLLTEEGAQSWTDPASSYL
jgi:hypothetical protein